MASIDSIFLIVGRCRVRGVRHWKSKKGNEGDSLVITSGLDSDFEIGCGDFDLSKVPVDVPVTLKAPVSVRRIGVNTFMRFEGAPEIELLNGAL